MKAVNSNISDLRNKMYAFPFWIMVLFYFFLFEPFALSLHGETERTPPGVGVDEKVGETLPLHLLFLDEENKSVTIKDYLDGQRPLLIVPSYYTCVRLCSFLFQGVREVADASLDNGMALGSDYRIVSISINPKDNVQTAREKGREVRKAFQNAHPPAKDWSFLTGKEKDIKELMSSLGYRYRWDPSGSQDISHTAAIVLVSPKGKITRYLYGIRFPTREFRLSLVEAANGRIGRTMDKILLYCFRYNPIEGRYTPLVWIFVRTGGVVTLLFLLGLWIFLYRKGKR